MRGIKNNLYKDLKGRAVASRNITKHTILRRHLKLYQLSSVIISYHQLSSAVISCFFSPMLLRLHPQDAAAALGSEVEDMGFATGTFSATGRPQK